MLVWTVCSDVWTAIAYARRWYVNDTCRKRQKRYSDVSLTFQYFDEEMNVDAVEGVEQEEHGIRQKRATCDLLSYFNVNHSACAAHCVAIGRKGGYCNGKAVCVCRR